MEEKWIFQNSNKQIEHTFKYWSYSGVFLKSFVLKHPSSSYVTFPFHLAGGSIMLQVLMFRVVQVSTSLKGRKKSEFIDEQFPIKQVDIFNMQSPTLQGLLFRESVFPMMSLLSLHYKLLHLCCWSHYGVPLIISSSFLTLDNIHWQLIPNICK